MGIFCCKRVVPQGDLRGVESASGFRYFSQQTLDGLQKLWRF